MSRGEAFGPIVAGQLAAIDADLVVEFTADRLGWERVAERPGPWLVNLITSTIQGVADRTVRPCPHISPRRPSAAWLICAQRDRILCAACACSVLLEIRQSIEDDRCDVCGVPVARLNVFCTPVGGLIVSGGACRDCWHLIHRGRVQ